MVRPAHFGYNAQTAVSNSFQHTPTAEAEQVSEAARREFDGFAETLLQKGIPVHVFDDLPGTLLPDSVFPNNWFSTHPGGIVHIYPMLTPSRQGEVRTDIIDFLKNRYGYTTLRDYRSETGICEGTGSLVFDHENRIGYAVLSPRTHKELAEKIIRDLGYSPVFLEAFSKGQPVYHSNVVLFDTPEYLTVCRDALSPESFQTLTNSLPGQKQVLNITPQEMDGFAGNALAVDCPAGNFLVLSETAARVMNLEPYRKTREIITAHIPTIETIGGGSARCMLAEIF